MKLYGCKADWVSAVLCAGTSRSFSTRRKEQTFDHFDAWFCEVFFHYTRWNTMCSIVTVQVLLAKSYGKGEKDDMHFFFFILQKLVAFEVIFWINKFYKNLSFVIAIFYVHIHMCIDHAYVWMRKKILENSVTKTVESCTKLTENLKARQHRLASAVGHLWNKKPHLCSARPNCNKLIECDEYDLPHAKIEEFPFPISKIKGNLLIFQSLWSVF